jgi:hypothetical protein
LASISLYRDPSRAGCGTSEVEILRFLSLRAEQAESDIAEALQAISRPVSNRLVPSDRNSPRKAAEILDVADNPIPSQIKSRISNAGVDLALAAPFWTDDSTPTDCLKG